MITNLISDAFDTCALSYDGERRFLVPGFDEFYGSALESVMSLGRDGRVLDLGAGTGLFSGMIAAVRPDISFTLVDVSREMMAQAEKRFAALQAKATFIEGDYTKGLPTGPWDAVVSALSIHHLTDDEKKALFKRVRRELAPGGVFVNADQVAGDNETIDRRYDAWWEQTAREQGADDGMIVRARERMAHDRSALLTDQLGWFHDAGFVDVHCPFKRMSFAVMEGVVPNA